MHNIQVKIMILCQRKRFINDFMAYIDMGISEPKFVDSQDIFLWEKYIQKDKFYKFIIGLRSKYDGVKTSPLHRSKVSQMSETITEIKM